MLSKSGRTELIHSTLSNISNHTMNVFLIPKTIRLKMDKIARNFFWGHDNTVTKIHTINWKKITKPKAMGGLGIRTSCHQNKALILKRLWTYTTKTINLWTKIVRQIWQ